MNRLNNWKKDYKNNYAWLFGILICGVAAVLINRIYLRFLGMYNSEGSDIDRLVIFYAITFFGYLHFLFSPQRIYEYIYRNRFKLAFVLFVCCVFLRVHGSSIAEWNNYFLSDADPSPYQYPILGKSRSIRSDEWMVYTPLAMSQKYTGYSTINDIARAWPTNMLTTYNQPVWDITVIAKPFYWGYLLFGQEAGLAWFWSGRTIGLFVVTFELFQIITKRNRLYALAAAFLITFSACVQWWFIGGFLGELLFFGQLAELMIYYFLNTSKRRTKLLCAVVFSLCGLGYMFSLYPAWMIPLFYVFAGIAIWIIIDNFHGSQRNLSELLYLLISFAIISIIAVVWLIKSKETIAITMNTVYPGKRISTGGEGLSFLFYYINNLFLPYSTVGNSCSASMAWGFFPITEILVLLYLLRTKKKDKLLFVLACIDAIFLSFVVIGFPELVAKITFLNYTTSHRLCVIITLIEVLMYIRLLSLSDDPLLAGGKAKGGICILMLTSVFFVLEAENRIPDSFNPSSGLTLVHLSIMILILCGFIFMFFIFRTNAVKEAVSISFVLLSIATGAFVNPVMRTTDAIYDKPLSRAILSVQDSDPGTWIATGSFIYPNFLIANSAPAINSANIFPVLERWNDIDPAGEYSDVYNRYAHIIVDFIDGETDFSLVQADLFQLRVNFDDVMKLGVDYILSPTGYAFPNDQFANAVDPIYTDGQMVIYKIHK